MCALIEAIDVPYVPMARSAMTRWSDGRVTLLGDACHAALRSCPGVPSWQSKTLTCCARLVACGEDFASALSRYEAARIGRTTRVVDGSAANAKRFHNPRLADDRGADDYITTEWSEAKVEQRYDWLFTYDALNVAI
jgi:salicylate hydroxylase